MLFINLFSQNEYIKAKVIDATTQKPLQYVNIYIKGSTKGTVSNIGGDFYLSLSNIDKSDTLIFSMLGYKSKKIIIKNINNNSTIKLKPHNQTIEKVTVKAKRTNPANILKNAMQNVKENVYNKRYQTKVFSRNFVQKDSVFVLYRKALTNATSYNDDVWGRQGDILADRYLTLNKNVFNVIDNNKVDALGIVLQTFESSRNFNENEIKNISKNIVKIDTVIFSENQKIYVIDYIESSLNPKILPKIYGFIKDNSSPYSVIFDKKAQNNIVEIFDANEYQPICFTRYYIDAKQNYNIIKTISFNIYSSFDVIAMIKSYWSEYTISYYTNTQKKSILNHSISYRKTLYTQKEMYKYYDFSSLYEQFCYEPKFILKESSINKLKDWEESISYKYNIATRYGISNTSYDKWNNAENFIKTDTLEQRAIDQILHPEKYYDVENFYAKLDSANKIKVKREKREKPMVKIPMSISGTIIDSITYEPLPYCNIIIKNIDDTTKNIIGAITNEDGKFMIDLLLGYKYFIQISQLGYKSISDTFDLYVDANQLELYVNTTNTEIGNIELVPQTILLKTATVKGSTKSIDIDNQSTIITPDMRKNTIAAKDLLNKVDGVNYNKITEEIKVDGSKKIKLLVDGVEKTNDYILNLNPKRVKKIEILHNLSGLYATEAYTAVINIITYDNYRGSDFTINDQLLDNLHSKNNLYFLQNNTFISLNIARDKWNYYVKASNFYNDIALETRSVTDFTTNNETIVNRNNSLNKSGSYGISLGTDYKINKKHLLGVEIGFNGFPAFDNNSINSFDTLLINGLTTIMQNTTNIKSKINKLSGNLYYNYRINKTSDFITYFYLTNKQSVLNQDINNERMLDYKQINNNINYKLEYNKTFKNKYTITIGGRYLANNFKSIAQDTIQEDFINNSSKFSAYSYLKIKFYKNIGLLMGGIYENYKSENNDIHTSFNSLQPKINLYKTINKKQKIVLSYSLKTEYPYLSDMNPQINYITPFIASMGNLDLIPYLYHNFSIQYSKISDDFLSYLFVKPYYNFSDNEIGTSPITNDSIIIYQNKNFVKHKNYGIYTGLSLKISKKFKIDLDCDIYKDWNKNINTPIIIDWNGDARITYSLNVKHYFGLLYQKEYAQNVTSLGYSKAGVNYLMIYWKTLQLKGRLQLMLGYSLPILPTQINEGYEKTPYYVKNNYTDVSFIKNMILVNLVFRISKGKVEKTNKNIDYEDYNQKQGNQDIIGF